MANVARSQHLVCIVGIPSLGRMHGGKRRRQILRRGLLRRVLAQILLRSNSGVISSYCNGLAREQRRCASDTLLVVHLILRWRHQISVAIMRQVSMYLAFCFLPYYLHLSAGFWSLSSQRNLACFALMCWRDDSISSQPIACAIWQIFGALSCHTAGRK